MNPKNRIYPSELQDKMDDILKEKIIFSYSPKSLESNFSYNNTSLILQDKIIKENIIIYSSCGGGNGYILFKELRFNKNVINICKERYDRLIKPYLCIHIRNTDYKCDYAEFFIEHENEIRSFKEIYIATDDKTAIDFYREKGLQVKNFTTFPEKIYNNLHYSDIDHHTKFLDMICDIFIIGLSNKLMSNSCGGFIKLVRLINKDPNFQKILVM